MHLVLLHVYVALLLDVIAHYARKFLVPHLPAVYVHEVLDVLKRSFEVPELALQTFELDAKGFIVHFLLGEQATRALLLRHKHELLVARLCNVPNQLLTDSIFEQLPRIELYHAHERALHRQDPLAKYAHLVRCLRQLFPLLRLLIFMQLLLLYLAGHLLKAAMHGYDAVQHHEHGPWDHLQHCPDIRHHLRGVILRDAVEILGGGLRDPKQRQLNH
mmetsp:Transcript_13544/g.46801  ORF Transcript_13544/g.46801 Transcript_13544/m.46801 type:complete len:217 (+) Transcript_13544:426-1076(+)